MDPKDHHYHSLNSSTGKWTLFATIVASAMAFIDSTALNVILPSLQEGLQATGTDLFWMLNSYLLMLSSLIIIGGSLGDQLGRVKVFKWGISIFIIGSILCGMAPNMILLILFRGIQGVGGAFMIPGSLAIISAIFNPEEKGKAIGTWSAVTTVVTICGPILGGSLADLGLWRLIFYINVPLGLISLVVLHLKVPESRDLEASQIDWLGGILMILGLGVLTFGLLEIPELGIRDPVVIISCLLGVVLLVVFILVELKHPAPMFPLSLFNNSTFLGTNLLTFFLYAGLGGMMLFLSLNIIELGT